MTPATHTEPGTDAAVGLLLAAGAGRRMGGPKALLHAGDGTSFLDRAVAALLGGGCAEVVVVLGAAADRARELLSRDDRVRTMVAADWDEGMGASLRAGLRALAGSGAEVAVVGLVDLPDVGESVVERVLGCGSGPGRLVRATYDGRPGHPVVLGREHWAGVAAQVAGSRHRDHGARDYFRAHPPVACECGDLASGRDVDRPEDLGLR